MRAFALLRGDYGEQFADSFLDVSEAGEGAWFVEDPEPRHRKGALAVLESIRAAVPEEAIIRSGTYES